MEKLKLQTPDLVQKNIEQIGKIFPNVITETWDETGTIKKAIDFDILKQTLSDVLVEDENERYRLDWPGKKASLLKANLPITKTLRPVREESVDFDTTENLFIEGDNFEALKILQESYLGKIKMIYIDPPYNTGKDFIYRDNYKVSKKEYEEELGVLDDEGGMLIKNTDTNGRFHSEWLSMIYERLLVVRDFLTQDGVIFISIDDNEVYNLRKICDEIFGENNFLTQFAWRTDGNFDNQAKFKKCHEYVVVYSKNAEYFPHPPVIDPNISAESKLFKEQIRNTIVKNGPKNPISGVVLPIGFPSDIVSGTIKARTDLWPHYEQDAIIEDGQLQNEIVVSSGWSSKEIFEAFIKNNCKPVNDTKGQETVFTISQTGAIEAIKKRTQNQSHVITVLNNMGGPQRATSEIESLGIVFDDYPKPIEVIKYFLKMNETNNFFVLDFFAGSATTAHACVQLNAEDKGYRKFIMVQIPEKTREDSEAAKAGYNTIDDIGKERIRRAGKMIKAEYLAKYQAELDKLNQNVQLDIDDITEKKIELEQNIEHIKNLDIGFRVYKTDTSNMKDIYYHPEQINQDLLSSLESNIKEDRTAEDLLTQVILDLGLELSLSIEKKELSGNTVFFVQHNALAACFDESINFEIVNQIAEVNPFKVVFRDASFKDDKDRINVEERFKRLSPETVVTVI